MNKAIYTVSAILAATVFFFVVLAGAGHMLGAENLESDNLEKWLSVISLICGGLISFISVSGIRDEPKKKEADDERNKNPGQ